MDTGYKNQTALAPQHYQGGYVISSSFSAKHFYFLSELYIVQPRVVVIHLAIGEYFTWFIYCVGVKFLRL